MRFQVDEGLAHVDPFVVGTVIGAPLFAHHFDDFGKVQQTLANVGQDHASGIERDARRHLDEDDEVPLVQLREELGAEMGHAESAHHEKYRRRDQSQNAPAHRDQQGAAVPRAERDDEARLAVVSVARPQKKRAERRDCGQREDERAGESEAVGHRQRMEDPTFDPFERKNRNQRGDDDRHGVKRRRCDVECGRRDQVQHVAPRLRPGRRGLVKDVFNQHDRAVHENAEIDRSHRDQVRRQPEPPEADERGQEREGDDRSHDQRAAQTPQEQPDDPRDEEGAEEQAVVDRFEREADERRPIVEWLDLHPRGEDMVVQLVDLRVDAVKNR